MSETLTPTAERAATETAPQATEQKPATQNAAFTGPQVAASLPGIFRHILSLEDFEPAAKPFLPKPLFEFISGGVERNFSRADNREVFEEVRLLPRMFVDTTARHTGIKLFGKDYDAPFGIAPMGASAMAGYRADIAFARAAAAANIQFILSGSSLIRLEEIVEANPETWFQAYFQAERELIGGLSDRVWTAGYRTLVVTADVPVGGNRENNVRAGFSYPLRPTPRLIWDAMKHPKWLTKVWLKTYFSTGMPHFENTGAERGGPILSATGVRSHTRDRLNWDDMAWLRERWQGNLIVKGILAPDDAERAKRIGFDGVIVSNHGGRQLDGATAPLRMLPEIAAEAGDMAVLFDGGIRRGNDVIKALALGADYVFVGRPMLYAAALGEQAGLAHAIELLKSEIHRNLALMGSVDLNELKSRVMVPPGFSGRS